MLTLLINLLNLNLIGMYNSAAMKISNKKLWAFEK